MNDRNYGKKRGTKCGIIGALIMATILYWSRYCSFSFDKGVNSDLIIIFITALGMILFARKSGGIMSSYIDAPHSWIGVGFLYGLANLLFTTCMGAVIFVVTEGDFKLTQIGTGFQIIGLVMMISGVMALGPSMVLGLIFGYGCDRKIDRSGYV